MLERYGETSYYKTKEGREKLSNIGLDPTIKQKKYDTHKINKSFNISKTENQTFNILKMRFSDLIRQYKSEKYPFSCDFYVPSKDLYIECNYHWTHGGHPYKENNKQDKEKVEYWKSKQSQYYNNAINTWTSLDVRKRRIAKENKLNYIEIFSINEIYEKIFNKT